MGEPDESDGSKLVRGGIGGYRAVVAGALGLRLLFPRDIAAFTSSSSGFPSPFSSSSSSIRRSSFPLSSVFMVVRILDLEMAVAGFGGVLKSPFRFHRPLVLCARRRSSAAAAPAPAPSPSPVAVVETLANPDRLVGGGPASGPPSSSSPKPNGRSKSS
ncbi:hypothetical protein BHM03_00035596 [Ensete ventricosum]|nr:hypothetical protein BHM03_00035596 [Ensete ventricosum]